MAAYGVNLQGLRKRPTYDELIGNLNENYRYPNRVATQLRNSPQLTNLLDGEGMGFVEMEKQQLNRMKEELKEHSIRQAAAETGGTAQVLRALETNRTQHYETATDNQSQFDDLHDTIGNVTDAVESNKERQLVDAAAQNQRELDKSMVKDYVSRLVGKSLMKNYVSQLTMDTMKKLTTGSSSSSSELPPNMVEFVEQGGVVHPPSSRSEEKEQLFRNLTKRQLENELRNLGLPTRGRKEELIQRLLNH